MLRGLPRLCKAPLMFSTNFYIKSKVPRVSIFGYLAADKQRKHFRHLFWMIQCRDFRRCSPFGKFPVFSPLLLAVIDEEKKPDRGGKNTVYLLALGRGELK